MVAATELKSMQKAIQISGALTDEAVRNGTIKKVEKSRNVGEPSKDMNGRDDNKRTRTVNAFATTVNPVGRENMGTWPRGENDYSSEAQQDGRVKNVISRALIGSLKLEGHVAMKKAQGEVGFTLLSLTQLAQAVTSKE
ncbi:hypothetical protein Tco_0687333 [Tanacetum coccineum]